MLNGKKILIWAPFGSGKHYWGPGISLFNLLESNPSVFGKNIILAHSYKNQEDYPEIFNSVSYIAGLRKENSVTFLIYLFNSLRFIITNRNKIHSILGLSIYSYTLLPAIFAGMLGIKSYIKVTSNTYFFKEHAFLKNKYKTIIKSLTNKYISGIIVLNSGIADYYKSAGINPNKIYKIPNGINISKFKPRISQLGEKDVNNRLWNALYVGGLTYGKGIIELTESLKYLKEAGLCVNLSLVGPDRTSGKITKQIEYITKRDKTENMIKLYGHQNNPIDFFQLSEIFILPTHSEGMSNALLEAISAGLYCIVTDIDGNNDIIKNGINGLFTNGTPQDIADKIAFAINDQKFNYICTNARKTAINKFNSEIIINSYFNLLVNNRFEK